MKIIYYELYCNLIFGLMVAWFGRSRDESTGYKGGELTRLQVHHPFRPFILTYHMPNLQIEISYTTITGIGLV